MFFQILSRGSFLGGAVQILPSPGGFNAIFDFLDFQNPPKIHHLRRTKGPRVVAPNDQGDRGTDLGAICDPKYPKMPPGPIFIDFLTISDGFGMHSR